MPGLQQHRPKEVFPGLPGERPSRRHPNPPPRVSVRERRAESNCRQSRHAGRSLDAAFEGSQSTKEVVVRKAHSLVPDRYARSSFRLRRFRRVQCSASIHFSYEDVRLRRPGCVPGSWFCRVAAQSPDIPKRICTMEPLVHLPKVRSGQPAGSAVDSFFLRTTVCSKTVSQSYERGYQKQYRGK